MGRQWAEGVNGLSMSGKWWGCTVALLWVVGLLAESQIGKRFWGYEPCPVLNVEQGDHWSTGRFAVSVCHHMGFWRSRDCGNFRLSGRATLLKRRALLLRWMRWGFGERSDHCLFGGADFVLFRESSKEAIRAFIALLQAYVTACGFGGDRRTCRCGELSVIILTSPYSFALILACIGPWAGRIIFHSCWPLLTKK